ncbi:hypothetical protein [[Phormidium] sp. ETS-05]|uniref:hypothetical protein n=1 Tax=[Phormidium] sp. ETS-05 TaxID=222819 RepID=UPI0018EF2525|nr:hypothetical protein [[Phormidium] sp. ETS-05]
MTAINRFQAWTDQDASMLPRCSAPWPGKTRLRDGTGCQKLLDAPEGSENGNCH